MIVTNESQKKAPPIKVIGYEDMKIPDCCREGWASCPHVIKPKKPVKKNIGL